MALRLFFTLLKSSFLSFLLFLKIGLPGNRTAMGPGFFIFFKFYYIFFHLFILFQLSKRRNRFMFLRCNQQWLPQIGYLPFVG